MSVLRNQTKNLELLKDLKTASTFFSRAIGLLGRADLPVNEALWIHDCNSIHTFGMRFTIDCIFISKDLKVISVVKNVKPWRLVLPQWGAKSVIELKSGNSIVDQVRVGDQLHVGT